MRCRRIRISNDIFRQRTHTTRGSEIELAFADFACGVLLVETVKKVTTCVCVSDGWLRRNKQKQNKWKYLQITYLTTNLILIKRNTYIAEIMDVQLFQ